MCLSTCVLSIFRRNDNLLIQSFYLAAEDLEGTFIYAACSFVVRMFCNKHILFVMGNIKLEYFFQVFYCVQTDIMKKIIKILYRGRD